MKILLLALMLACGRDGGTECNAELPCGFGETCVEGYCRSFTCNTSLDCPMEHVCSDDRTCVAGCTGPQDCYPGNTCDLEANTCIEGGCLETALDCGFGEFCNTGSGECYEAGPAYCKPCSEDAQCGPGNICYAAHCAVDCAGGRECPAGFDCTPFTDESGQIVLYQCLSLDCDLYDELSR